MHRIVRRNWIRARRKEPSEELMSEQFSFINSNQKLISFKQNARKTEKTPEDVIMFCFASIHNIQNTVVSPLFSIVFMKKQRRRSSAPGRKRRRFVKHLKKRRGILNFFREVEEEPQIGMETLAHHKIYDVPTGSLLPFIQAHNFPFERDEFKFAEITLVTDGIRRNKSAKLELMS